MVMRTMSAIEASPPEAITGMDTASARSMVVVEHHQGAADTGEPTATPGSAGAPVAVTAEFAGRGHAVTVLWQLADRVRVVRPGWLVTELRDRAAAALDHQQQ